MSKLKKTILANNFLDLTEVKLVGKKHDSVGILSIIKAYFAMSESSEGFLDKDEILMIAEGWGVEDPEAWLALCVDKNIFTEESGRYFNTHVQKDRENYEKKLEYDRNRKGKENDSIRNESGKTHDLDIDSDIDIDPSIKKKGWPPEGTERRKLVYLTDEQMAVILKKISADELNYWLDQLTEAAQQAPEKWKKKYKDHLLVIRAWRRRRLEDGKVWDPTKKIYFQPPKVFKPPENVHTDRAKANAIRSNGLGQTPPAIRDLVKGTII